MTGDETKLVTAGVEIEDYLFHSLRRGRSVLPILYGRFGELGEHRIAPERLNFRNAPIWKNSRRNTDLPLESSFSKNGRILRLNRDEHLSLAL